MKKTLILAGVLASLSPVVANAATGDIPFNGTVATSCTITVGSNGRLAQNTDATVLSSKLAAGESGTATVVTNSNNFDVSVADPSSFSVSPSGFSDSVTFDAEFAASGATTIGATGAASPVSLNAGTTNVSVDLVATNSTASFPNGDYTATVVLTCE